MSGASARRSSILREPCVQTAEGLTCTERQDSREGNGSSDCRLCGGSAEQSDRFPLQKVRIGWRESKREACRV